MDPSLNIEDNLAYRYKYTYGINDTRTLAYLPEDAKHIIACPRRPLVKLLHIIPKKYYEDIAANAPNECCHSVDNLEIEAWYTCEEDKEKGVPDLYKFYCSDCMNCHVRWCLGFDHPEAKFHSIQDRPELYARRPFWVVR